MTQQDATKVVRDNIEGFSAGDWQKVKGTLTPDHVYQEYGSQRRIQGPDETVKADQAWKQAFPDAKGTIRSIVASGSTVVAEVTWEGTHRAPLQGPGGSIPATGKRVTMPAVLVCTVQGGKIKEAHHYFDMMTMLQQLGVMQQPRG